MRSPQEKTVVFRAATSVVLLAVATAQLKRGMKMGEVSNLFGPGKQMSESVSGDGLKTQVFEYVTGDRRVDVTYVEGLVVRYSISSN
jgi:hypothetical protein